MESQELESGRSDEEVGRLQELEDECENSWSQSSNHESTSSPSANGIQDELSNLEAEAEQTDDAANDIKALSQDSIVDLEPSELDERCKKLEAENEQLRVQSCDINDLASQLETCQAKLEQLKLDKKKAEIELKHMKDIYEKKLSSYDTVRVENIFKNSGAQEYMARMKDAIRITEQTRDNYKREMETNKKEAELWRKKYDEVEKQSNEFYEAYRAEKNKNVELEAKLSANHQIMNMSSASSIHDRIPSPPPVEMPPIAELMRKYGNPNDNDVRYT